MPWWTYLSFASTSTSAAPAKSLQLQINLITLLLSSQGSRTSVTIGAAVGAISNSLLIHCTHCQFLSVHHGTPFSLYRRKSWRVILSSNPNAVHVQTYINIHWILVHCPASHFRKSDSRSWIRYSSHTSPIPFLATLFNYSFSVEYFTNASQEAILNSLAPSTLLA